MARRGCLRSLLRRRHSIAARGNHGYGGAWLRRGGSSAVNAWRPAPAVAYASATATLPASAMGAPSSASAAARGVALYGGGGSGVGPRDVWLFPAGDGEDDEEEEETGSVAGSDHCLLSESERSSSDRL